MFKVIFKVLLALAAIFASLVILKYLGDSKSDYIEIYNSDDYEEELFT